jgi:hypothetical protein
MKKLTAKQKERLKKAQDAAAAAAVESIHADEAAAEAQRLWIVAQDRADEADERFQKVDMVAQRLEERYEVESEE